MQGHEDFRQTQHQIPPYGAPFQLLVNTQNSTHDINKPISAAAAGMYAPGTAAMQGPGPQHHQPGQAQNAPMVQQQMNHRPMMMNSMSRPNHQMSMSRNPMGGVSQGNPHQQQQYPPVHMLQQHNLHAAQSLQVQTPVVIAAHPSYVNVVNRSLQYQQQSAQQLYFTQCFNYPQNHNNAYFPMPGMQSCPPVINQIPETQQHPVKQRKLLNIVNPDTGENITDSLFSSNESKSSRSAGSDVATTFASQVAAVAAKDPTVHRISEDDDTESMMQSPGLTVIENDRDSGDCEMTNVDICDPYMEDMGNSRETPTLSYSDKDSIDVHSISDTVPIIPDIEPDPDIDPQLIVNHEEMVCSDSPPEHEVLTLNSEVEEDVQSNIVDSPVEAVHELDGTNCVTSDKEFQSCAEDSSSATSLLQGDSIEVLSVSPSSDLSPSNKLYDTSLNSSNALKSDKPTEGKKPKNKKKREVNRKGESKEGSEMDAFLIADSTPTSASPPPPAATAVAEFTPELPPSVLQSTTSVLQSSVPSPVATSAIEEPEEMSAESFVTNSIVVENDAELPEETSQVDELQMMEDVEDDSAVLVVDEVTEEDIDVADKKEEVENGIQDTPKLLLQYSYKEDQWSPLNPEGKKQYDRDFLIKLQAQPMSLMKPSNLPNLDVIKDIAHVHKLTDLSRVLPMPTAPRNAGVFDFMPQYVRAGGPQRPPHPGMRRSQQGRERPSKKVIAFSSSLGQTVKLHESENAWKPMVQQASDDNEDASTQELFKKVRGILNKLTPQKFQTLLGQVKELDIVTEHRLNGVIDLVFEKAIDEPNFSVPYANMCKQLAMIKVPYADNSAQHVNFRKLLLTKCQREFEQDNTNELERMEKLKLIEECDIEDKKKLLQEEFDDDVRKNRRRQLGNIRFIGELFKLGMLIEPIMHDCIKRLLEHCDEDSLECLCRLLSTIGKELDPQKDNSGKKEIMAGYMNQMTVIVNKRKTSSRVRFMLQDVMELKKRDWVPRRDENNPKTIDQIHKEAEQEAQEQQQLLQNMQFAPKRMPDDNRKKNLPQGRPSDYEAGWQTSNRNNKSSSFAHNFDPAKIKFASRPSEPDNIQLGPGVNKFMSWGRGSSGGYNKPAEPDNKQATPLSNRYTALQDHHPAQNVETRRGSQRSAASSRESSRGRNNQMSPLIRKTPSASKERENAIEAVNRLTRLAQPEQKAPPEPAKLPEPVKNVNGKDSNPNALRGSELSQEEVEKKTKPLIDEFLNNNDYEEATHCIIELFSPTTMPIFITEAINKVLERSSQSRIMFGQLLYKLVKSNTLNMEQYNKGFESVLECVDDYALDIPKIWEYLGEILQPMGEGNANSLKFLEETLRPCIPSLSAGRLVSAVLHCSAKIHGPTKVGEMWLESGLQWSIFLPPEENVSKFTTEEKLEFTICPTAVQTVAVEISMEEIKKKLDFFLVTYDNNDAILDWIESQVGEKRITEPSFVRALVTAVFENAITGPAETSELSPDKCKNRVQLLSKYVSATKDFQLQTLYAVQALVNRLAHPKGVLKAIFDLLYDDDIVTDDIFKKWEESSDPAEQEGKGVAKASVAPFFTWLREADEESEEG